MLFIRPIYLNDGSTTLDVFYTVICMNRVYYFFGVHVEIVRQNVETKKLRYSCSPLSVHSSPEPVQFYFTSNKKDSMNYGASSFSQYLWFLSERAI